MLANIPKTWLAIMQKFDSDRGKVSAFMSVNLVPPKFWMYPASGLTCYSTSDHE